MRLINNASFYYSRIPELEELGILNTTLLNPVTLKISFKPLLKQTIIEEFSFDGIDPEYKLDITAPLNSKMIIQSGKQKTSPIKVRKGQQIPLRLHLTQEEFRGGELVYMCNISADGGKIMSVYPLTISTEVDESKLGNELLGKLNRIEALALSIRNPRNPINIVKLVNLYKADIRAYKDNYNAISDLENLLREGWFSEDDAKFFKIREKVEHLLNSLL